jgi:excinuclease ABC subunit A
MADVATLLLALQQLVSAGNALLIVEHHLDIINNADHLIELGPGAGSHGGRIIFSGTPELAKKNKTPTGVALTAHLQYTVQEYSPSYDAAVAPKQISVIQAREHNLKNLSVNIPHNQLVAITGISGSGKSTLAFNILFAEGQRRYLESLNAFSRQFIQPPPRPEVDALLGMPPAIAIEQRTSRGGQKSTVATTTEIYHYLRQLFLTLGEQHCPDCQIPITAQSFEQIEHQIRKQFAGQKLTLIAPLIVDRKGLYKELADWASNAGFSELWIDGKPEQTDNWPKLDRYKTHDIDLTVASLKIPKAPTKTLTAALEKTLNLGKGRLKAISSSSSTETKSALANARLFSTARACPSCQKSFAELDPRLFSYNSRHGSCLTCDGTGVVGDETKQPCPACHEQRLNPTALAVKFHQHSIGELCQKSVADLAEFFANIKLDKRSQTIGQPLVEEIKSRLQFLLEVGLDYLSLQRGAPTLSGGEAQRIRLASQIGNHMSGACYVLDEPTIGLHARDNQRLVRSLSNLVSQGNSVIVVEHDEETIRAADHIIDIGPGAGMNGGQVVTQGTLKNICKSKTSLTAKKLSEPDTTILSKKKTSAKDTHIILKGATKHNLKNLTVKFPLHRFIGVAGVSGSGKSTLIRQVLEPNLRAQLDNPKNALTHASELSNIETVGRILEVDQTPIGRTPRSCPSTYIGIWDDIRKQLSNTQEAQIRGWKPNRFSFNNKDGCCAECGGQGQIKIEMNFLPDVREPCQSCKGMRFNQETLQIKLRDKTAGEILDMPVDDAMSYFEAHPKTHYALSLLQDIGLGYLKLGQPSPTLSGGEAQRIKLVTELSKAKSRSAKGAPHTLYILDEPTVGLHMADVDKLTTVLHQLVDQGHSVIVIEHNLDLLKACDWLIELGPEGGKKGGKIIAEGMIKNLLASKKQTPTLQFMR